MNYQSTQTINSRAFPGVTYSLRKMSRGRRTQYMMAMAETLARQSDIQREFSALTQAKEQAEAAAKIEPCVCGDHPHSGEKPQCDVTGCACRKPKTDEFERQLAELEVKHAELVISEINPGLVRWGLASISGFEIDGVPATAETLITDGPEDLLHEIASEVVGLIRPTNDETENFASPSTSGARADGQTPATIAPTVSETASI